MVKITYNHGHGIKPVSIYRKYLVFPTSECHVYVVNPEGLLLFTLQHAPDKPFIISNALREKVNMALYYQYVKTSQDATAPVYNFPHKRYSQKFYLHEVTITFTSSKRKVAKK